MAASISNYLLESGLVRAIGSNNSHVELTDEYDGIQPTFVGRVQS